MKPVLYFDKVGVIFADALKQILEICERPNPESGTVWKVKHWLIEYREFDEIPVFRVTEET